MHHPSRRNHLSFDSKSLQCIFRGMGQFSLSVNSWENCNGNQTILWTWPWLDDVFETTYWKTKQNICHIHWDGEWTISPTRSPTHQHPTIGPGAWRSQSPATVFFLYVSLTMPLISVNIVSKGRSRWKHKNNKQLQATVSRVKVIMKDYDWTGTQNDFYNRNGKEYLSCRDWIQSGHWKLSPMLCRGWATNGQTMYAIEPMPSRACTRVPNSCNNQLNWLCMIIGQITQDLVYKFSKQITQIAQITIMSIS